MRELRERLGFLVDVGVGYLSLDRAAGTLSGGEAQRIRLATQIGSHLVGVLYILDEPSIGLHQRDNHRLIDTLTRLRDIGNTVIVVEHDEDTVRAADWVIDMGPGAGEHGGEVVAEGTPAKVARTRASVTGAYLSGRRRIPVPVRRGPSDEMLLRPRRAAAQPQEHRRRDPGRAVRGGDRRVGLGQVDARQRRDPAGAQEPAPQRAASSRARTAASRVSRRSTR